MTDTEQSTDDVEQASELKDRVEQLEDRQQKTEQLLRTAVDLLPEPSRRSLIKSAVLAGAGGVLGAAATGGAGAADTSVGQVGASGSSVDVVADEIRDDGGDVVVDIDDTGAVDFNSRAIDNLGGLNGGDVVESANGKYEIQKNGSDGTDVINFKT